MHDMKGCLPIHLPGNPGFLQQQNLDARRSDHATLVEIQAKDLREPRSVRVHDGLAVSESLQDGPDGGELFRRQDLIGNTSSC